MDSEAGLPRSRYAVAAIAVTLLSALGAVIAVHTDRRPTVVDGLPAALANQRRFDADPGHTGLYTAAGTTLDYLYASPGSGAPVVTSEGVVVYLSGSEAYRIRVDATKATPIEIGPAVSVFPASGGAVGLQVRGTGSTSNVEILAPDGYPSNRATSSLALSDGASVVAQLSNGLLVESSPYQGAPSGLGKSVQLQLYQSAKQVLVGAVTEVVATHGSIVAALVCPPIRTTTCPLHLIDTATGITSVVPPPPGYNGYETTGGAFSPNGASLVVFVASTDRYGGNHVHLTIIKTGQATPTVVDPDVPVYESDVSATWSSNGH